MPRTTGGKDPIAKFQAEPPPWLTTSHSTADLGYYGFHPPRRDQEEDMLSEHNVKNGYSAPHAIGAETFNSHNINVPRVNENALPELEDLMNQVLARRAELHSHIPEHAFKLPQRITLSEIRRQTWHNEFFKPDVPLHTIGEKIPHAKGHDLLTLLQENHVSIPRAIWYVRGLGGNETQGMRNRLNYNPTQYSVEWANVVTSYLKKLLAEIALPSAARPGLNIKQTFKGVLNDPETREKWVSKICYCLDLLREFYAESLVDHCTFLSWLAQQLHMSNLAQANFVVRIVDEYLEGMLPYRCLQRALIDGCLAKYSEIQSSSGSQHLTFLVTALSSLLQRMFIHNPDPFVNPRIWINHSPTIISLLRDPPTGAASDQQGEAWKMSIENDLDDVTRRNDALLFRTIPERATATAKFTMNDIKVLNSITDAIDMSNITILNMSLDDADSLANRLDMLLTWSITQLQYGDHRPYAIATLLSRWRHRFEDGALRRGSTSPDELLQDSLFDWLDTSEMVLEPPHQSAMVVTFAALISKSLFSYTKYIQRLIARGEQGLLMTQEPPSRHRILLRSLPLYEPSASLVNQRKVVLYGISCRTAPEETKERELRRMLRTAIPELFGGESLPMHSPTPLDIPLLVALPRYEQMRVLRYWLYPIFERHIKQSPSNGDVVSMQTYVSLMHIMVLVQSYDNILDINLELLQCTETPELLGAIVDTLRRYTDVWTSMDEHGRLLDALCKAHEKWNWETRRAQCRPVLCLLIEFHDHPRMPDEAKLRITEDATALMQGLRPPMSPAQREPSVLPRIATLVEEDDTSLATNIWLRHGLSASWVQEVWQNTLDCLRGLSSTFPDAKERNIRVMRYAHFLWDIDQHLRPGALDELISQWATGPGCAELRHLDEYAWTALSMVLLYLVTRDVLTAPTIMKAFVYPVWELCAVEPGSSTGVKLSSVNYITTQLIVPDLTDNPVRTCDQLYEVQKLQTRRRSIYTEENFSLLVTELPNLVVLENRNDIDTELRTSIAKLRIDISKHSEFRMVAYRNLEMVLRVFWTVDSNSLPQELERLLGDALQRILSDSDPWVLKIDDFDWRTLSCFLSPWRYSRTAIELQLALRSLGVSLKDEKMKEKAEADLSKFGSSFFGQPLTAQETDLVADMLRGISGVVANKLVNSGMQRITQLFQEFSASAEHVSQSLLHNAGEVLHLISSILQPLRAESAALPQLQPEIQDAFVNALKSATEKLYGYCGSDRVSEETTELVVVLARLWQFDLCLPGAWTPRMREVVVGVLTTVVRLSVKYSCGMIANSVVFDVLIDTAFLLSDEIPRENKTANVDLFQHAPQIRPEELPLETPLLHRRRICSLMAYVPQDSYVHNLVHAWRDPSLGTLIFGRAVQNNPWEWAESIEPPVTSSREKPPLRNSSSIPLEVFGTRPTGERIVGADVDPALRQLEDGLAADGVFARDWRETRLNLKVADWVAGGGGSGSGGGGGGGGGAPASPGGRSSATASVVSSHGRSMGVGDGERLSVGSGGTRASKRKASTASLELEPAEDAAGSSRGSSGGRRGRGRGPAGASGGGGGGGRGKGKKK